MDERRRALLEALYLVPCDALAEACLEGQELAEFRLLVKPDDRREAVARTLAAHPSALEVVAAYMRDSLNCSDEFAKECARGVLWHLDRDGYRVEGR